MNAATTDIDTVRSGIGDKSITVLDVRRPQEYKQHHIPTSRNLSLHELLSDDSPQRVAQLVGSLGISNHDDIVVYDDTFGALASRVAWTLEYLGHQKVSLLDVTYGDWTNLGLETATDIKDHASTNFSTKLNPDILATYDHLENRDEKIILLDNRERLNYLEQHIPGAINIPYRTLASADGVLRDKDSMKRIFRNRGIDENSRTITYCGSVGTLSGLAYYALKSIGVDNTKLYVRSFREWKNLKKPTEKQEDANYWDLSGE